VIVVDVQRDFCDGALAASDTESLLIPLQNFIQAARQHRVAVIFTQDWHPADHSSFKQNGGKWPVHCVAGERGSELMPQLQPNAGDLVVHKGVTRETEGYSAFELTGLSEHLRSAGVKSIGICGIATEYCVRRTVLDAARAGFTVTLLTDLIRPVDSKAAGVAVDELVRSGIALSVSNLWLAS
jgi:nicotinamidase/pyrazinamidase